MQRERKHRHAASTFDTNPTYSTVQFAVSRLADLASLLPSVKFLALLPGIRGDHMVYCSRGTGVILKESSTAQRCNMPESFSLSFFISPCVHDGRHRNEDKAQQRAATQPPPPPSSASTPAPSSSKAPKKGKEEGTIASVFASLSGGSLEDTLPSRFSALKQSLIESPAHVEHLQKTWNSVLPALAQKVDEVKRLRGKTIPEVEFPGSGSNAHSRSLSDWTDARTYAEIKDRGAAVIRNVVPRDKVLEWKQQIREYAAANNAKGFPADNPQVYELYWSKPQLEARSHPNLIQTCQTFLQLFHSPASTGASSKVQATGGDLDRAASLSNLLMYVDRLRIRQPGDAKFALGAHIDGGGVERWECDEFRALWDNILRTGGDWRSHDPWSLGTNGERMAAKTDMYEGPGQCGVFRPLQGWLSMSDTKAGEGTLKLLPFLRESTAYIVLRPFFSPRKSRTECASTSEFLDASNWVFDGTSKKFPGCSLGHNIELDDATHPHLELAETMTSVPQVGPGDMVLWHCDGVHSVESHHRGTTDSSVLYIPAIPTTKVNWQYIQDQKLCFHQGIPPPDFPGGKGESQFQNRGTPADVSDTTARRSLGLEPLDLESAAPDEQHLLRWCNEQI
ncbi:DUF1479-domain-containing protein [Testicularia cyperi]|uniref:DUF1479-domain-containing protein n=1 Tax=Testicularia cyperi TaxID=1882483 RepID=A0A317XRL2_9BASI|nr:DUF1479-domain-containing protein [Testicularia cyperi]